MSDGGKGSAPRPYSVDQKTFANNWDKVFGDKQKEQPLQPQQHSKESQLES